MKTKNKKPITISYGWTTRPHLPKNPTKADMSQCIIDLQGAMRLALWQMGGLYPAVQRNAAMDTLRSFL